MQKRMRNALLHQLQDMARKPKHKQAATPGHSVVVALSRQSVITPTMWHVFETGQLPAQAVLRCPK
jgi:hypothetical protein